jgi:acetyl esterase/lipase
MSFLIGTVIFLVFAWAVAFFFLRGEDLSAWDSAADTSHIVTFNAGEKPSPEHWEVVKSLPEMMGTPPGSRKDRLRLMRERIDGFTDGQDFSTEFIPADAGGVPGEWVLAPGSDASKRLLYIHGGAFIMCSAKSHRAITSRLAEVTGAAVLSIDYRLMPENRRVTGVADCRTAYRWILANGPEGPAAIRQLFVAGDSAGGNLALALSAWVRDEGLKAPDAVVALSPLTDSTMSSPSMKSNLSSDLMLGPMFGQVMRLPRTVLAWFYLLQNRINPRNPVVSPVFADLSGLPPTLVQASEAEMLLEDARRYVNKARSSGSPAILQTWPHMLHVWQIFYPQLPEAGQAFEEIASFLAKLGTAESR